jgi:peptidyl-prolyl cis-trans isomerase SurA
VSKPIAVSDGVYILDLRDKRAGAATEVVELKQAEISLPTTASTEQVAAAKGELETLRHRITGCESLDVQAAKSPGVVAGDLGETDLKDLRPSFQTAIAHLKVGQVSEPVRTDAGLHLIVVCERHAGGARAVTRADIEDKLRGEQFDMFARRFLRDLRNSATIETR